VFKPESVSVPVPILISPPPVAPELLQSEPLSPQSLMTPLTAVLRLLPPTVSRFEPR
jgi:hypothetical protein